MEQRIKLDPLAYLMIGGVLAVQIYTSFVRTPDVDAAIGESDRIYKQAVFDDSDNKGIMQQIFRQNEVDRELLKLALRVCAK